jgi:hypothetical protein
MLFPTDELFGNCQSLTFERNSLPNQLWIQFLGYYNRDHIQVFSFFFFFLFSAYNRHQGGAGKLVSKC